MAGNKRSSPLRKYKGYSSYFFSLEIESHRKFARKQNSRLSWDGQFPMYESQSVLHFCGFEVIPSLGILVMPLLIEEGLFIFLPLLNLFQIRFVHSPVESHKETTEIQDCSKHVKALHPCSSTRRWSRYLKPCDFISFHQDSIDRIKKNLAYVLRPRLDQDSATHYLCYSREIAH